MGLMDDVSYNTTHHNPIQYNTIQYNTIQYNTLHYITIQYNTFIYITKCRVLDVGLCLCPLYMTMSFK